MYIMITDTLSIGAWQGAPVAADIEANLEQLDRAAAQAAAAGVELLVTPEMFLTGYNLDADFRALAEERPLERVEAITRRHGIAMVVGGPELLTDGPNAGGVVNAAWAVDPHGSVLAKHHKVQLFGELDRALFVPGDRSHTLFTYRGFSVAMLICFDVEFPEMVRRAAHEGAELFAVPTAQMQPFHFVNEHVIRVRAYENNVFVAYANHVGEERDFTYVGRSVIAGPDGVNLAQAGADREMLIQARVDRSVARRMRSLNPYLAEVRTQLRFDADEAPRPGH